VTRTRWSQEVVRAVRKEQFDDGPVRWAYAVVLVIPLLLVVATWILNGANDAFARALFPAVAIVHGGLLIGLVTRRLSLRTVGPIVFASPMAILLARLVAWELNLTPRPVDLGLVVTVLTWFGVVFALAFLVFGTRRGAAISVASYAVMNVGMVLSASGGMLVELGLREVIGVAGAHAVLLAVVWVLARNVEQLSAARATTALLALQATTDPLTGIANRRHLDDELERAVAQAHRYGHPLSAVLADLDHFKVINDTFGHEVGDRVLVAAVGRMLMAVRDADLLGRWGGEEFLLLAPHTDHPAARALAERCRREIGRTPADRSGAKVTASFGVATLRPGDDARTLMRRLDLALYEAKSEGRDRVVGIDDLDPQVAAAEGLIAAPSAGHRRGG
jgi:diguanylate cyclase (GGDEF)-like protein